MFAPSIGVPEDIAKANSIACLAAHPARGGLPRVTADVGDSLGTPSTITAVIRHDTDGPEILVGGAAGSTRRPAPRQATFATGRTLPVAARQCSWFGLRREVPVSRELTGDEWELVEPLLPVGGFGPYPERLRQQFEGVIRRFRTGSPWRDMPTEHGAWQTVCHRFLQWRDEGVFEQLMDEMIAEAAQRGQVDLSLVSVDSTVARAHHITRPGWWCARRSWLPSKRPLPMKKGPGAGTKGAGRLGRRRARRPSAG